MTDELDSARSWRRLATAIAAAAVASVGMWSSVLVLPQVQAEFGADRADATLAYSATMLGFGAGNALLGRMVDRHGISRVLTVAAVVLAAGFALAAASPTLWLFALAQGALIGFGAAAGFAPLIADISHWFVRRRGIAVAATASGNYLAGAVWPMALADTLATDGWRAAYAIIAAVCLLTLPPLAYLMRAPSPALAVGAAPTGPVRSAGLSPQALTVLLCVAGIGCCIAMATPQVHIVAYCADLGYGVAVGAEMLSLMLTCGILSRLFFGLLADRIGGVPTLLSSSALQCLALFLYIPFDGLASLYAVSAIFGLAQGGIVPTYAIIVREFLPAREAGRRVGVVILATVVGMAVGGWLSGRIYDVTGSYQAAFLNGIVWNLLNIAVMVFLLRRGRGPQALPA